MQRINTINFNEYLIVERSLTNTIILHNYDSKTFEGTRLTLSKEQAKELVNKLQELIYAGECNNEEK
jgi:HEPN domain-containing protein